MTVDKTPVIIGCDHAAFGLKETIRAFLEKTGLEVEDAGAMNLDSVHYPDFGIKVATGVSTGKYDRGILLCGTGLGMSMVANKFSNVRAALCNDMFSAIMSRRHNDANILVLGARVIGDVLAMEILKSWLEEPFEGGRHQMRLDMFDNLGEKPDSGA